MPAALFANGMGFFCEEKSAITHLLCKFAVGNNAIL